MVNKDELIGQNVIRLRGEMTQQALADAMRTRGYKWSQATVWSVEKGERPLRLSEASDVAKVLHTSVDHLLAMPLDLLYVVTFTRYSDALDQARQDLEGAAFACLSLRDDLREQMREHGDKLSDEAVQLAELVMTRAEPESTVARINAEFADGDAELRTLVRTHTAQKYVGEYDIYGNDEEPTDGEH